MRTALITGITGQDGSYLTELLLQKGYIVHGIIRRSSNFNTTRIDHLLSNSKLYLHYGDLTDHASIARVLQTSQPDELYNLGAQSHVKASFDIPEYSGNVDGLGAIRILDAVRTFCPTCRVYQASTSELFGKTSSDFQNENTSFYPRSPYGVAKLYAHWITINFREAYGLFASTGILFNHESIRRTPNFVTRKITKGIAQIIHGKQQRIVLGNLAAKRDWGYAPDYVYGMWKILQHSYADDFILATGVAHSVEEFCTLAFSIAGLPVTFSGTGIDRKGFDKQGQIRVEVSPDYYRPTDVTFLCGDATKANTILGWKPTINFSQLVELMVKHDLGIS
jgi:GDPmannose 4,6-dehydratase